MPTLIVSPRRVALAFASLLLLLSLTTSGALADEPKGTELIDTDQLDHPELDHILLCNIYGTFLPAGGDIFWGGEVDCINGTPTSVILTERLFWYDDFWGQYVNVDYQERFCAGINPCAKRQWYTLVDPGAYIIEICRQISHDGLITSNCSWGGPYQAP